MHKDKKVHPDMSLVKVISVKLWEFSSICEIMKFWELYLWNYEIVRVISVKLWSSVNVLPPSLSKFWVTTFCHQVTNNSFPQPVQAHRIKLSLPLPKCVWISLGCLWPWKRSMYWLPGTFLGKISGFPDLIVFSWLGLKEFVGFGRKWRAVVGQ